MCVLNVRARSLTTAPNCIMAFVSELGLVAAVSCKNKWPTNYRDCIKQRTNRHCRENEMKNNCVMERVVRFYFPFSEYKIIPLKKWTMKSASIVLSLLHLLFRRRGIESICCTHFGFFFFFKFFYGAIENIVVAFNGCRPFDSMKKFSIFKWFFVLFSSQNRLIFPMR